MTINSESSRTRGLPFHQILSDYGGAGFDKALLRPIERASDALEFERAVKVQACPAGDLHAIAIDSGPHASPAGTELLRTKRVLTQPPRPIWSQCAMYRPGRGVLIDADRR